MEANVPAMYLLALTAAFYLAYFALYFLFPYFFEGKTRKLTKKSVGSVIGIVLFSFAVFVASAAIDNAELSNRVLHVFGGGFLSFLICFLAVRDSGLKLPRFRFFLFSFLIVIALGSFNEIAEYFLQNYLRFGFARNVNDTWLDLMSNVTGALIASAVLVPRIKKA